MQIKELCNLINVPKVVQEKITKYENEINFESIDTEMSQMNDPRLGKKQ